jgi:hypothetical protein
LKRRKRLKRVMSTKPLNTHVSLVRLLFEFLDGSNGPFHGRDMVVGRSVKGSDEVMRWPRRYGMNGRRKKDVLAR